MGAITNIPRQKVGRMAMSLATLAEFAAEGRLNGLIFIAQIDKSEETVGMFGDYSSPECLTGLAARLAYCADGTGPRPQSSASVIPLKSAISRNKNRSTDPTERDS